MGDVDYVLVYTIHFLCEIYNIRVCNSKNL
jgi:hypothetical protein